MTKLMTIQGRVHYHRLLHYTACGLDDVYLVNGFSGAIPGTRRYTWEEDNITVYDVDSLWKAIGLSLVRVRKALAPKEVRFLRNHMKLTQAELGERLRVTDQTVARWEKGITPLPGPADLLLRVLFVAAEYAQPEGGKMLEQVTKALEDLRERDEPERPTPIAFRLHKKWEFVADTKQREIEKARLVIKFGDKKRYSVREYEAIYAELVEAGLDDEARRDPDTIEAVFRRLNAIDEVAAARRALGG